MKRQFRLWYVTTFSPNLTVSIIKLDGMETAVNRNACKTACIVSSIFFLLPLPRCLAVSITKAAEVLIITKSCHSVRAFDVKINFLDLFQLLWLAVDNYKLLSGAKDMAKTGEGIYRSYLSPNAVSEMVLFYVVKKKRGFVIKLCFACSIVVVLYQVEGAAG